MACGRDDHFFFGGGVFSCFGEEKWTSADVVTFLIFGLHSILVRKMDTSERGDFFWSSLVLGKKNGHLQTE